MINWRRVQKDDQETIRIRHVRKATQVMVWCTELAKRKTAGVKAVEG